MTIPDFQTFMLPLLEHLKDGKDHKISDVYNQLAIFFKLTPDDKRILLPSGRQPIYKNRIGWARTYMAKAGLIASPSRGVIRISAEGLALLKEKPQSITVSTLKRYPEFVEFHKSKKDDGYLGGQTSDDETKTPRDIIEEKIMQLNYSLEKELLELVRAQDSDFLEVTIIDLLRQMGYGGDNPESGKVTGGSGDGGIDGYILEDPLGMNTIFVQAKCLASKNKVGREDIQRFIGALSTQGTQKGIFVTTSSFTRQALECKPRHGQLLKLIDGEELAKLMVKFNLGVSKDAVFEIKKIDNDYFEQ